MNPYSRFLFPRLMDLAMSGPSLSADRFCVMSREKSSKSVSARV
jgi:hypothetical protein